jgi:hypothetical protein
MWDEEIASELQRATQGEIQTCNNLLLGELMDLNGTSCFLLQAASPIN